MKNKINSYMEYKKEFNDLIKNCDLKTNSRTEIKKSICYWSNYFNVSKLEYIRRLKVYVSFYRSFWVSLDTVNTLYEREKKSK